MLSSAFQFVLISLYLTSTLAASDFDWQTLTADTTLNWKPCYSGFQCSRLQVPLDYSEPNSGSASIAIVRLPSTAPRTEYRGPILFNPGGPGGSGVDAIVAAGAAFATVFGPEFDIVGFDPRGVSYSTPQISFFKTDVERRFLIPFKEIVIYPSLNASSNAVSKTFGDFGLLGQLALQSDTDHYLQHMSTDNIARDMLRITQAFGFEKVQYWGISYGSVLGATFATLFPDKIGRLMIDGVEDMDSYYTANVTNLTIDVDASLQAFFDGCEKAGPDICPFYAPSPLEIAAKLDALTTSIKEQPLPVVMPDSHGIVDFLFLRNAILYSLFSPYDPVVGFVSLGQSLAALAEGNATTLYTMIAEPSFECQASPPPFHLNNFEAYIAIACGDPEPINDTVAQLEEFWMNGTRVSQFSDLFSVTRVLCAGYKIHRQGRFQGPVGAKNTSFPLLLVGNTLDSATARAGALKTSKAFPGSVVLTQDSVGHTSTVAPSLCTYGHFRAYFMNGTLPAPGTVCPVDAELFPSASGNITSRRLPSVEEKRLLDAGREISSVLRRAVPRRAL
ncbi:TAP-like protein-domain-containing protein [Mycena albidolilacea]|uniref:TAP-like protein-domain-containing protein n=1 Tax=Mycena albidolilacea TaxID=1033008 RepID=A0AAD7EID1_9AGAR|nr:TAP-like protein-domain-containing protein [Mycena albidolilacea]